MSAHKYVGSLIFFIIATFFSQVVPAQAGPVSLYIKSFDAPGGIDNWSPWTGDGNSYRNWYDTNSGGNYWFQSTSYGTGDMSCLDLWVEVPAGCIDRGAGGWSRQWLDVTFEVVGDPGQKANVSLDWSWEGSITMLGAGFGYGNALSKALIDITRPGERLYKFGEETSSWTGVGPAWLQPDEPFTYGDHIDLGTMTVGDEFRLSAFHESNAFAHTFFPGAGTAGMFSTLKIELNATEASAPHHVTVPKFTQIYLEDSSDILNEGLLVEANNLGDGANSVSINDIDFGNDHSGLSNYNLGDGDFYADSPTGGAFDLGLDLLLSNLVYQPHGGLETSLQLTGLTTGRQYRLQLLFSNDENTTGDDTTIELDGFSYNLNSWIPEAVNLVVDFWATSDTATVIFPANDGSAPKRAVLNGYVLHELRPTFNRVVISGETDILNEGILVEANNLGSDDAQTVRVNGIDFGNDHSGLSNFNLGSESADFYQDDPPIEALDPLLSTLVYQPFDGSQSDLQVKGLTIGHKYRLQLLFSNDEYGNETGHDISIGWPGIDDRNYSLAHWKPDSINLIIDFRATSDTATVIFTENTGVDWKRAVLNGYALHEYDPSDGDGIHHSVDTLPHTFSNTFSDGMTTGVITDRGDQDLTIIDTPDPNEGVVISADPGGGVDPAAVSLCGGASQLFLDPGDEVIVTCSSVTIESVKGTVEVTFVAEDGTKAGVSIPNSNSITIDLTESAIAAGPDNDASIPIDLTNGGEQITIEIEPDMKAVLDATPPILILMPDVLWPPNHEMVDVRMVAKDYDLLGNQLQLEEVTISSNEPEDGTGIGDRSPDWTDPLIDQDTGLITFQLRAERSDSGDGRVYTITVKSTDEYGNESLANAEVIVPYDNPQPQALETIIERLVGIIADLSDLSQDSDKKDGKRIEKAIKHIAHSLDPKYWESGSILGIKGKKVFNKLKKAVKELKKIDDPTILGIIESIIDMSNNLAQTAIDDAIAAGGSQKMIEKAQKEMAKAQKDYDKGKYDKAIDHYKKAWKHAQKAHRNGMDGDSDDDGDSDSDDDSDSDEDSDDDDDD